MRGHLHLTPCASSLETPTIPKSKPNSIIRISNWCKGHSPTSLRLSARSKAYGAHTLTLTFHKITSGEGEGARVGQLDLRSGSVLVCLVDVSDGRLGQ